MAYSWRMSFPARNRTIAHRDYVGGVRDAFGMYEQRFVVDFVERPSQRWVSIYVIVSPWQLPQDALAIADRYGRWGYRVPGAVYISRSRNLVNRDQVRVVVAHEMGHLFGARHTGGRWDIMNVIGYRDTKEFSPTDVAQLRRHRWLRRVREQVMRTQAMVQAVAGEPGIATTEQVDDDLCFEFVDPVEVPVIPDDEEE